ncbi:serine hydrolase, partial [Natronospira sp.]
SLDDPVNRLLPDDSRLDRRLREEVALWQLATHVSGLPNTPDDLDPNDPLRMFESYTPERLNAFLEQHPLAGEPGKHFAYSNLGYALLGQLLAEYADSDFATQVEEALLAPLALDEIAARPRDRILDQLTPGHDYDLNSAPSWELSAFKPAAGLKASARDLLRWVELNRDPSGPLADALALITRPQMNLGDHGYGMGLGWQLFEDDSRQIFWHSGRTAGYSAFAAFDRDQERSVVVLSNTGTNLESLGFATLEGNGEGLPPLREGQPLDRDLGALYVGRYQMAPGFVVTVRQRDADLFIRAPGRPPLRLYSINGQRFFTRGVDSEVHFLAGEDGAVDQLRIETPNGAVQLGHRMHRTESKASREVAQRPAAELQRYAGIYRIGADEDIHIQADRDRLLLSSGDGPSRPLYPAPDGRFFHRNQPLELVFSETDDGQAGKRLILFRNGHRLEAEALANQD